MAFKAYKL